MGVELATAYVSISSSAKGVSASVKDELGVAEAATAASSTRMSSSIGGAIKSISGTVVGITTAVAGLALGGGFRRALAIDDGQAMMSALGYSTTQITSVMSTSLAAVKGTMFGLGDSVSLATQLIAAGIKPGQDLARSLGLTADMAAVANTSLGDLAPIMAQLASSTSIGTGDLLQLQERGLPIFQWLADSLGTTQTSIRNMVSSGKISFSQLETAIEQHVGGAAKKTNSFRASWENTMAALSRWGAALASPGLALLKTIFDGAIPAIDALTAKMQPVIDLVVSRLSPIITDLATRMKTMFSGDLFSGLSGLGPILAPLGGLIAALGASSLGFLPVIGPTLATITGPMGLLAGFVATMLVQSAPLRAALGSVFTTLGSALSGLSPLFGQVASMAGTLAVSVGGVLASAITMLLPFVMQLVQMLGPILSQALTMAAPILGLLVNVISGLVPVMGQLLAAIMPVVDQVLPILVSALGTVVTALLPPLSAILGALAPIFGTLITALAPVLAALGKLVATVLPPLIQLLMSILGPILSLVAPLLDFLAPAIEWVANLISSVLVVAFAFVGGAITTLVRWIQELVNWLGGGGIGAATTSAGNFFSSLWSGLMAGLGAVGSFFSSVWTSIVTTVQTAVSTVLDVLFNVFIAPLQAAWQGFWGMFGGLITAVWDFIVTGVQLGIALVELVLVTAWNAIVANVTAVWNGLVSIVTNAVNQVLVVVGLVLGFLQAVWNAIWGAIGGTVTAVWDSIVSWVTARVNAVHAAISIAMSMVQALWSTAWSAVSNAVSSAWTGISSGVRIGVDLVVMAVTGFKDRVVGFFTGAGTWLYESGKAIIQGLIDGITHMISGTTGAMKDLLAKVSALLPHSPALEGPFSGKGWTLYSGQAIGDALGRGISDASNAPVSAARRMVSATRSALDLGTNPTVFGASMTNQAASGGGYPLPEFVTLVDSDGTFIARMRTEARGALGDDFTTGSIYARKAVASQ